MADRRGRVIDQAERLAGAWDGQENRESSRQRARDRETGRTSLLARRLRMAGRTGLHGVSTPGVCYIYLEAPALRRAPEFGDMDQGEASWTRPWPSADDHSPASRPAGLGHWPT